MSIVAALLSAGGAEAQERGQNYKGSSERAYASVYGQTLPPIGFVDFCGRNPDECRPVGHRQDMVRLTPERWGQLKQVNEYVNGRIAPVSDMDLYNMPEYWDYPSIAGDCEDFVLLKKRYLEGLGFPAETLLITVVLDEAGDGHAVLLAHTNAGDLVLDNRRNEILRWSETRYEYLKRQSQADPRAWVSMTAKSRRQAATVAGGN